MRFVYFDIDTLRADHLGCYGYHRDTSPNIDALASDGVRFENVYASDVPCLPSRTALITGMFGTRNGVVNHGGAAADPISPGARREFITRLGFTSWAAAFYWSGWRTASFSSFPFRHSAQWWNTGFMEAANLMRGMGAESAHQVAPGVIDWLDRNGGGDDWFLHVHLWDPHTPYNTPEEYGNPFADDEIPAWHTEDVRAANWELAGPHSAQEPWGYTPDEWGRPPPRQPWNLSSMADVKATFDGYDVGIRWADHHVGIVMDKLADLGIGDETAVLVSSDHGEAFGELGVYADHQAADEATCHIPSVMRWPGITPQVHSGLQYHLDVATTVTDLAGIEPPRRWDGQSVTSALRNRSDDGRDHLVLTQGAWSAQRGVRTAEGELYLRTWHDGHHAHWPEEMLFDLANDPHEQINIAQDRRSRVSELAGRLEEWTVEQLDRGPATIDPMQVVLNEGGPYHTRHHLPAYLERLRDTGRGHWAEELERRHPTEVGRA